ncbi:19S proteasome regulatory subunit Rpn3 [Schizosaccharomyces cryophilus OY26]|uniref:19S proteasome regulatory subunit Rpn3 n=1 Tax=Schizosaccharomyces cryophilus (strain OY26 / ATCC MYA-4695 / CBS 11777 / NBRC 106824 / NRRL Y48691) TaxID=653667 RepID=S9X6Q4_SCHCR|nr:19S proteasome regulatory subunit Rpn3 [Schizosaccharomyces cryophilus OY26]EPY49451.1 19S proteasome regulatory subunit Rpn3 [Schizosaccharomyces cryophilus OY26]
MADQYKEMEVDSVKQPETTKPADQKEKKAEVPRTALQDVEANIVALNQATKQRDPRLVYRALRTTSNISRRLSVESLGHLIKKYYASEPETKKELLSVIGVDGIQMDETKDESESKGAVLPEVSMYLQLLVGVTLFYNEKYDDGACYMVKVVHRLQSFDRRTLDQIAAKLYFYYTLFLEKCNRSVECRNTLLAVHRTATLRHDTELQAMVLTLLLRNYIHFNLYDQADRLVSKTVFPSNASNNLAIRYQYYLGRIRAIQLDYTTAHEHLVSAIRKAPNTIYAVQFLQAVYKLHVVVQLLMGEIPERRIFRQKSLEKTLIPYLRISQAVRIGDLNAFTDALSKYETEFRYDGLHTLICRLRHTVIKTGLRMISLSYSRVSLRDVCIKLGLDSEESAEYIVAKGIRDGVIDASIDHNNAFMASNEAFDIYSTEQPQQAFHERIQFCLALHNDSVKSMRYPMDAHKSELEDVEEARRRMDKEMAEADLDDDEPDLGDF